MLIQSRFIKYKQSFFVLLLSAALMFSCNSEKNSEENGKDSAQGSAKTPAAAKKTIVFFGNSLTAGYGLDDPSQAFSGLIQKKIDSLGLAYKVINAGVSGETTAGGNSRIDWLLKQPLDIFVLELGGNDGLRGIPVTETRKNLQSILDKVKAKYPNAQLVLAGMQIPPNMGKTYSNEFKAVYKELADKNSIKLIPFLLEGVGGEAKLNQTDGIHPTAEGHRILADNVWVILKDIL
ncbi:arylesterase [Dyadobacter sp. CY312]|uniref:arylesterase n=1 Tax=Dyadobacter sp. CY312 TaxID=2907303 RepID=UPI001F37FA41|nr:arylesterase [Dyadobacter sp. CY312]MCE7040223.1 arylesterase [Dyadobacter sp. CY312]